MKSERPGTFASSLYLCAGSVDAREFLISRSDTSAGRWDGVRIVVAELAAAFSKGSKTQRSSIACVGLEHLEGEKPENF